MIDNVTGKATRVDVRPLKLEMMLKTTRRDRPLLIGYLLASLIEAAQRLWPEFVPIMEAREPLVSYPLQHVASAGPNVPFLPRWRRRLEHRFGDDEEIGQGLVEYALILALIAIIAIVALMFLGSQIAAILSGVGASIPGN